MSTDEQVATEVWREIFNDYGWEVSDEFMLRYQNDPWIYNLANALLNERRHRVRESSPTQGDDDG